MNQKIQWYLNFRAKYKFINVWMISKSVPKLGIVRLKWLGELWEGFFSRIGERNCYISLNQWCLNFRAKINSPMYGLISKDVPKLTKVRWPWLQLWEGYNNLIYNLVFCSMSNANCSFSYDTQYSKAHKS